MQETKARVRQVLEALAEKYSITAKDVSYAIDGYADDMLSDLVSVSSATWNKRPKGSSPKAHNRHEDSSRRALAE